MHIRFSKSRHGPVLVCVRDDGSVTGMKDRKHGAFFLRHDLMHYTVESVSGIREASTPSSWQVDRSIHSIGPAAAKICPTKPCSPGSSWAAVDRRLLFGEPVGAAAINAELTASLEANAGPAPPVITQASLDKIVETFRSALARFHALDVGEHIALPFPLPAVTTSG